MPPLKPSPFGDQQDTWSQERSAFEKTFNKLPNHVLTLQHKRKVPSVSVEECARRCLFEQTFRCAGFDYEPGYANCWLTDRTVAESGVKFHTGADFYERDFGGALSNFISFGHGSLPFVDDSTVYQKSMFHLDLGACAQVCLSQTTFDCASFDYVFGERSCHMSRYVASTVGGLQNETMPTHRVMHYEKKAFNPSRPNNTPTIPITPSCFLTSAHNASPFPRSVTQLWIFSWGKAIERHPVHEHR
ncbi:hypothetical protein PoB_001671500 [Plakobranchus ocellatus]|uniref:Apple domain-containing protein n=1 Tax=Plakobranchus ocellatus TaxID=259542 RepID=A0AAV3Z4Z2_9GAST|nr:hypothetical protein PoB_001671500 [Plakobranchus ocellatus]